MSGHAHGDYRGHTQGGGGHEHSGDCCGHAHGDGAGYAGHVHGGSGHEHGDDCCGHSHGGGAASAGHIHGGGGHEHGDDCCGHAHGRHGRHGGHGHGSARRVSKKRKWGEFWNSGTGNSKGNGWSKAKMMLMIQSMTMLGRSGVKGGGWRHKKTFTVDKSGGELGEFVGTIKSFSDRNGWGFIESDECGQGDVFLHADMKKGYRQGHRVKFTCVLNKDGKAVAIKLKSGKK